MTGRAIFESDIPSWSTPTTLQSRLDRWCLAGFDTVILQVDDGHGATWSTTAWGLDARVAPSALSTAVTAIHARGLRVVACVSLAAYNPSFSYYSDLRLTNFSSPFYNFWSGEFRSRRLQMLFDLSTSCDVDGIALDYLRTGREALGDEIPAASLLTAWLTQVRVAISPGVPLFGVHHSSYASGAVREGVALASWLNASLLDASILFNYDNPFNAAHLLALAHTTPKPIWALLGNYDWLNNAPAIRSGLVLAQLWRRVVRDAHPAAVGVYLANLLTDEQVAALPAVHRSLEV